MGAIPECAHWGKTLPAAGVPSAQACGFRICHCVKCSQAASRRGEPRPLCQGPSTHKPFEQRKRGLNKQHVNKRTISGFTLLKYNLERATGLSPQRYRLNSVGHTYGKALRTKKKPDLDSGVMILMVVNCDGSL